MGCGNSKVKITPVDLHVNSSSKLYLIVETGDPINRAIQPPPQKESVDSQIEVVENMSQHQPFTVEIVRNEPEEAKHVTEINAKNFLSNIEVASSISIMSKKSFTQKELKSPYNVNLLSERNYKLRTLTETKPRKEKPNNMTEGNVLPNFDSDRKSLANNQYLNTNHNRKQFRDPSLMFQSHNIDESNKQSEKSGFLKPQNPYASICSVNSRKGSNSQLPNILDRVAHQSDLLSYKVQDPNERNCSLEIKRPFVSPSSLGNVRSPIKSKFKTVFREPHSSLLCETSKNNLQPTSQRQESHNRKELLHNNPSRQPNPKESPSLTVLRRKDIIDLFKRGKKQNGEQEANLKIGQQITRGSLVKRQVGTDLQAKEQSLRMIVPLTSELKPELMVNSKKTIKSTKKLPATASVNNLPSLRSLKEISPFPEKSQTSKQLPKLHLRNDDIPDHHVLDAPRSSQVTHQIRLVQPNISHNRHLRSLSLNKMTGDLLELQVEVDSQSKRPFGENGSLKDKISKKLLLEEK